VRRPKVVVDIKNKSNPYNELEKRIDLSQDRYINLPISRWLKTFISLVAVTWLFFGFVYAPTGHLLAAQNDAERQQLESKLAELEGQIAEYESTVSQYRKQGDSLKSEISRLEAQIAKINLQIRATNLSLDRLNNQINDTTVKITETETSINKNKNNLADILQSLHESDQSGLLEIMLKKRNLSDFFNDINSVLLVQEGLQTVLQDITNLRTELIDQKETLALERDDVEALKSYQNSQQIVVAQTKIQKNELLTVTKGEESKYQELLEETKKTAAEIRQRIFRLLGGGELTFERAYELAKFAGQATGIREAFILAVLDHESALGKNVGQCQYDVNPYYPNRASNKTTMHPTRDIPPFLSITSGLGLDPKSTLVSCPIPQDGAFGGAMGPAQFIPSTWVLYENAISKITGNRPASPWDNQDAFVATALYLKDSYYSSSCQGYANDYPQYDRETLLTRCAAAQYYAGGRWYTYRWAYGEPVVQRAEDFERDIDVLENS